jgi:hypothetical protein
MIYSNVIENKLHELLPKKKKYNITDFKKIRKLKPELSLSEARFVVICTSIFHDAEYSKKINQSIEKLMFI